MPRRSQRAADKADEVAVRPSANGVASSPLDTHENGVAPPNGSTANTVTTSTETALVPVEPASLAIAAPGPPLRPEPGLYAVLGLDPTASDIEIQTTYRRLAARLMGGSGSNERETLKQLNVAYEVLGNPARRVEYDRLRLYQSAPVDAPTPIRAGSKGAVRAMRRRRPRQAVQPRYAGLGDVFVVLMVVGIAVLAGVLIIPRLSVNLSALNALQNVLPISSTRRVIDTSATPVPATPAPTATPLPGVAARFAGSTVSVSDPSPATNAPESIIIRLRRDGKPAANFNVWATLQYRTVQERWPASGALKTDASGSATISFNIGGATPNYPVTVHVFAQVDDQQQLSWSTTFTPH